MTEVNNSNNESQNSRPSLRCPSCSFTVPLPAETCPRCQANLRSGIIPQEQAPSGQSRLIPVALVLLVIIGLAVVFFSGQMDDPQQPAANAPPSAAKSAEGLADALDSFQDLPDENMGIRPDIILNRVKNTAEQAEDRRQMEKESENFQP